MKRTPQQFSFVIAALLLLLFAGPAAAKDRPFHGRIDGHLVTSPIGDPTVVMAEARAVGRATHLGAFTKVTSDVINLVTGEVAGAFTMTAANGDLLKGVYRGIFSFGTTPGTFSWVLHATITGGTGRFSHASGAFVFIADVEYVVVDGVAYGDYTETFDGTINY